ncbi:hypothetical protein HDU81_008793 [Chytriomyces hyalinus]|nr:hypothetical protein HDU81_008793 [Chytriomyces hyalinus]
MEQGFAVSTNSTGLNTLHDYQNGNQTASNDFVLQQVTPAEYEAIHGYSWKMSNWKEYVYPQQRLNVPVYWSRVTLVVIVMATVVAAACESWIMINDVRLRARLTAQNSPDGDFADVELFIKKGFTIAKM